VGTSLPTELSPAALAQTLAPFAATLVGQAPRSTILPPQHDPDTAGRLAVQALARIRGHQPLEGGLQLHGTLGSGGMGIVHLATQRSVGRRVAVKSLRQEQAGEGAVLALLQEAWVTGALEHPNILPVYDIDVDDGGRPLIVLKRIEGSAWSELLVDPHSVRERFGEEPLVWHLGVFAQVCQAVRFAHSRGILHRDLKPENVMIGEFGEVYLLDWGIAVSLNDDGEGRLPRAAEAHALAGTPAYMAPEMLAGDGTRLSERTDVYLLGAVLHEILTGRPPHRVGSLAQLVESVTSVPALPSDIPEEIARVCQRALDPEPDARFSCADSLRSATLAFLRHRGAARLVDRAQRSLQELHRTLGDHDVDPIDRRLQLYNLLSECRFGFREALAIWPENTAAQAGQRRALEVMIEYELDASDPAAAAALMAELADPPPELRARIDVALAAKDAERRELADLREGARQLDRSIGTRTRVFVMGLLGMGWTLVPFFGHYNREAYEGGMMKTWWPMIFIVLTLGLSWWARESLTKTRFNRQVVAAVLFLLCCEFLVGVAADILGISPAHTHILHTTVATVSCGMLAILLDTRLWLPAATYAVILLSMAQWIEYRFLFTASANAVLTVAVVRAWRPAEWAPGRAARRRGAA
jgi:eukaryotic-like serine/threonine-protein kinase